MTTSQRIDKARITLEWGNLEAKLRAWLHLAEETTRINMVPGHNEYLASLAGLYFGGNRSSALKHALQELGDLNI